MNPPTKTQPRPGYAGTASHAPRQNRPAPPPPPPAADDFGEIFPRPTQTPSAPPPRPPMSPPVTQRAPAAPTLADVMRKLEEVEAKIDKMASGRPATTAAPLSLTISKVVAQFTHQKGQAHLPMVRYYRVMGTAANGGNFNQSGITVYPEILEAAGIAPAALADDYISREVVAELEKLEGRTAYYTEAPSTHKPGTFSRKIVRIE
jgi:hypothetical protein